MAKKLKKKIKCFLSAKGITRAMYQSALDDKYNLIYTDSIDEAELFLAPIDKNTQLMSIEQKREFMRAKNLGITSKAINDEILDFKGVDIVDPLDLSKEFGSTLEEDSLKGAIDMELL